MNLNTLRKKVEVLEGNKPENDLAHLSDDTLKARIAELNRIIGEQTGLGRPATEAECREMALAVGVDYPVARKR